MLPERARSFASDVTVAALAVSVGSGGLYLLARHGSPGAVGDSEMRGTVSRFSRRRKTWGGAAAILAITLVASASWFEPGKVIANGDTTLPNGLAWLGRVFAPWTWSGSDLGEPNNLATQLPWGITAEVVHVLGGSAAQAQHVWLTFLFVGAGISAYVLLSLLGIRALGAVLGALAYVFNGYTISMVGTAAVYLAALALLPALAAIILATGFGRCSRRTGGLMLVALAPLLGYVSSNPPLLLLVPAAAALAIGAVTLYAGKAAVLRLLSVASWGVPLLCFGALYWAIPDLLQSSSDALGRLSALSSWAWQESRSTLSNALWLNTSWSWSSAYPLYFPFASSYSAFPLDILRYALPVVAFLGLPLSFALRTLSLRHVGLVLGSAAATLFTVFLSTGTLTPGNVLFDPLYKLPLGWLLQEPGRFLMAAALGYAVMLAIVVDQVSRLIPYRPASAGGPFLLRGAKAVTPWLASTVAAVVLLAPGYPLAFGQVVPRKMAPLPGGHVALPAYWQNVATHLNRLAAPGSVLVLPTDDFYQMPYRWGYYGSDGFITQLLDRRVVDPSAQVYENVSQELLLASESVGADLAHGQPKAANSILGAIGARFVLVRGDIETNFPGRVLVSPMAIDAGLERDPRAELIYRSGPLEVFEVNPSKGRAHVLTDSIRTPNLSTLSLFSPGTKIVTSSPRRGVPVLVELAPLRQWQRRGNDLYSVATTPAGFSYKMALVPPWYAPMSPLLSTPGHYSLTKLGPDRYLVRTPLGPNLLSDGSFR